MISFKAQCLTDTKIKKKNLLNIWLPSKVALIEINPKNINDFNSLKETVYCWNINAIDYKGDFSIAHDILREAILDKEFGTYKFYALTKQKTKFDSLNYEDMLGLAQIRPVNKNSFEIMQLLTKPSYSSLNLKRKVKHIGNAIISSISKIFPDKNILANPLEQAVGFYYKLGFKKELAGKVLRLKV